MPNRLSLTLRLLTTAGLLAACAQPPTPAPTPAAAGGAAALVSDLAGVVTGRPAAEGALAPVTVGFQLRAGGQVQTGADSRARLDFSDRSIVRLGANSAYTLQNSETDGNGNVLVRLQLTIGKIWVSLFGGEVQVETPLGVASVRGSFAVFTYAPGDPADPNDDLLVLDCLEGACTARGPQATTTLGNLERLVLGARASLRQPLTDADVQLFLQENPESARLVATLTALPPATATATAPRPTPTRRPPTNTPAPAGAPTTPTTAPAAPAVAATAATALPAATATPAPAFRAIAVHLVQPGETLFCIGRGYRVLPAAIAVANELPLEDTLFPGVRLSIPAVEWVGAPLGPSCAPQAPSPFGPPVTTPGTPAAGAPAAPAGTPTPTCPANEFFDPVMNLCRPANAPSATLPPTLPSATPLPVDVIGPDILNLQVNPPQVGLYSPTGCDVTFTADITDLSGVQSATLAYTVYAASNPTPIGSGTLSMLANGAQYIAAYTVSLGRIAFGTVSWSIIAVDVLGNTSTVASFQPVDANVNLGGCP